MHRMRLVLLLVLIVGCGRAPEPARAMVAETARWTAKVPPPRSPQHAALLRWAAAKEASWARDRRLDRRRHPWARWTDLHHFPRAEAVAPPSAEARATAELYFARFGRDRVGGFLWTGIETGNNLTMDLDERWDSLRDSGLYAADNRRSLVRSLRALGIRNLRIGMPNHLIHRRADGGWEEDGWRLVDGMLADLAAPSAPGRDDGLRISLDLHHFGIEDRFRVPADRSQQIDHERSFYLDPAWPDYFADFAREAFRRFRHRIAALTIINEPDTTTQFNAGFWHGGFPGFGPEATPYTAARAIAIAKAAVLARLAIEREIAADPRGMRPLFLHTEAAQWKPDDDDFVRYGRFLASDLILGHAWLLGPAVARLARRDPDTGQRTGFAVERPSDGIDLATRAGRWSEGYGTPGEDLGALDHLIDRVVAAPRPVHRGARPVTPAERYDRLIEGLAELRELHRRLRRETGMTMRSWTVLGLGYYLPNESFAAEIRANVRTATGRSALPPERQPTLRMRHEPQFYAEDIRRGIRRGLLPIMLDYHRRYPLPLMLAETGTAYFHYADLWLQQMTIEAAAMARAGVPFLGLTMYPALDTWGWDHGKAMSRPKRESAEPLPSGILWLHTAWMRPGRRLPDAEDYAPKPGVEAFVRELRSVFPR